MPVAWRKSEECCPCSDRDHPWRCANQCVLEMANAARTELSFLIEVRFDGSVLYFGFSLG